MIKKRDFAWNSLAGMINAFEAVFMSMIITRISGLEDAGILTIAFAVGNLVMAIGKFGVRNYQVTDADNSFSFSEYSLFRMITTALMALATIGYLVKSFYFGGYSIEKVSAIAAICSIYCVEAIEDVFWGEFQKRGRLDLGAKFFCIRWVSILLVFFIVVIISKNLQVALWAGFFISVLVFLYMGYIAYSKFGFDRICRGDYKGAQGENIIALMKASFPLFIVAFLTFYLNNSPKYAIDGVMSEEAQACYGFVAMPVFVIGLLNGFIYQPSLVGLSIDWNDNRDRFLKRVYKQCLILIGISFCCVVGAALIGIPVLSVVFGTDLSGYWRELVILQVTGMFLALSGYISVVLTIMRYQKSLMWGYLIVSAVAFAIMNVSVRMAGTVGAAVAYLGCMVLLCVIYVGMFLVYYRR